MAIAPLGMSTDAPVSPTPVYSGPTGFKPIGQDAPSQDQMMKGFESFNEDQKAMAFQKHLETGLKGMQEVAAQLPPEVMAIAGDPTPYAATEEKRAAWYMGVNQAINRFNAKQQTAAGDIAGTEQTMLNDAKATPQDFTAVAENTAARKAVGGLGDMMVPDEKANALSASEIAPADISGKSTDRRIKIAQQYFPALEAAGKQNGVDPVALKALMLTEANKDVGLDSKNPNSSAKGPFQFIDSTAKRFGITDPSDINQSAAGAAKYIASNMALFGGDIEKAIVGFHDGEGSVAQYIKDYGDNWKQGISEEGKSHLARFKAYVQKLGGAIPGSSEQAPGGAVKMRGPSQEEVAQKLLKINPNLSPDLVKKYADIMGTSGKDELAALRILMQEQAANDRNTRFGARQQQNNDQFMQKRGDEYQKNNKDQIDAGTMLNEVQKSLEEAGVKGGIFGNSKSVSIPGYGVGAAAWRGFLQSDAATHLRTSISNLNMVVRHAYFGATLTANELKAFKEASATGIPDNQEAFLSALRKVHARLSATLRPTGSDLQQYLRDNKIMTYEDLPQEAQASPDAGNGTAKAGTTKSGLKYTLTVH